MNRFVVKSSAACMPSSCWGRYRRVAVLEVRPDVTTVAMISARARGVVKVVATWEKLHCGKTDRDAFSGALRAAQEMADRLNVGEKSPLAWAA
jgi:hypothetical protein